MEHRGRPVPVGPVHRPGEGGRPRRLPDDEHGDHVLLPEWGRGYVLRHAGKARTPRAEAPPPARPLASALPAADAAAHGGVNFASPPVVAGATRRWHALGIMATSVLMGYRHDRFTRPAAVVNAPRAAWRLLGNAVQRDALESVCAPWIDRLAAVRDAAAAAARTPPPRKRLRARK